MLPFTYAQSVADFGVTRRSLQQEKPLTMFWCLDCHRNYEDYVRPDHIDVTNMTWNWENEKISNEAEFKNQLTESKKLNPPEECSACHR